MHTHLATRKKWLVLRSLLIGLVILSVVALIFTSSEEPVEAAQSVTLRGNDMLVVKPDGCTLAVSNVKKISLKVKCEAFTPTPTNFPTPGPDETVLSFVSEQGDYIGQGQSQRYTSNDSTFNVTLDSNNRHIYFSVIQGSYDHWWYLNLAVPEGQELAVGAYENATRYPFQDPDVPGLDFSGDGRGCNQLTGRFTVLEADFTPDHYVERFHATFEQHCEGGPKALFGEIQIVNDEATPTPTLTPTETPTSTPTATDLAPAPIVGNSAVAQDSDSQTEVALATIKRTLKSGKVLKVGVSGCTLKVKKNTASLVKVFCKPNPTPTPTKSNLATLYVGNYTGGTLCYEVYGSGIGQKCFDAGDWLYGSFPTGTYSVHLSARCGTADFSATFAATTYYDPWECRSGVMKQTGLRELEPKDIKALSTQDK